MPHRGCHNTNIPVAFPQWNTWPERRSKAAQAGPPALACDGLRSRKPTGQGDADRNCVAQFFANSGRDPGSLVAMAQGEYSTRLVFANFAFFLCVLCSLRFEILDGCNEVKTLTAKGANEIRHTKSAAKKPRSLLTTTVVRRC